MAIYHLTAKIISGGKGRSAVAAAAYRHGCRMYCEREARTYDYRHKSEANRSAIMLPEHVPDWLKEQLGNHTSHVASAKIWNAVEKFEKLHNAQYAREIEFAVPIELTRRENMKLVREFSKTFTDRGMIVDWSYHDKAGNPHVHMMMTLRPLTQDGFGPKRTVQTDALGDPLRNDKGVLIREHWAGTRADLVDWREGWARIVNTALEAKQVDHRVDHRSFADRGIDLIPTQHVGPEGRAMKAAGKYQERSEWIEEDIAENTKRILGDPTKLLDLVTDQKAVFEAADISRAMTALAIASVDQDHIWNQIYAGEHLELLQEPIENAENGEVICAAKYSTPELIALEGRMRDVAIELEARNSHPVSHKIVAAVGEQFSYLSAEQQCAVEHLTKASGAVTLTGLAGTGKSTLLKAANVAWSVQGYRVHGVALAGKAADELASASQIESRTLKSLQWQIENGRLELGPKDVVVLDEAGMVGSREMSWLLEQVRGAGAKIVMVGDPAQLPAISAGAAFRGIINAIGTREVSTIRRQHDEWQRNASMDFARGRVTEGLAAYRQMGQVVAKPTAQDAREALASSVAHAISTRQDVLALAHTNSDVAELNRLIREKLVSNGQVRDSVEIESSRGQISVGRGDHIVFLQNNPALGVRNGTRGTISTVTDKCISVWTEGGGSVSFDPRSYNAFAHGYAVTLHKAQGATVDHVRVLATPTMRRELAYVAMTRHRQSVQLYYGQSDFRGGYSHLAKSLGRAEAKETTLDYLPAGKPRDTARFAWARGIDVLDRWASAVGRGVKAIAFLVKVQAVVVKQNSSASSRREERRGDPSRADFGPQRSSVPEPHPKWLVEPVWVFPESDDQKANDMVKASKAYIEARDALINAPGFGRQDYAIVIADIESKFNGDREGLKKIRKDLCRMHERAPLRRFESKRDAEFRVKISRQTYKSRMELGKKFDHLERVYRREQLFAILITSHIRSALRGGLPNPHPFTQALLELLADRTTYRPGNWEKFEAELIKRLNDGFDIVSDVRRLKGALLPGAEEKTFECEDIRKTIPPVFEGRATMLRCVKNLDVTINHLKDTLAPQDYPKWLPSDHSIELRTKQGLQFLSHATLREVEKLYPAVSPQNWREQYDLAVSASDALSKRSQAQLGAQMGDIEQRANLVGVESMAPLERIDRVTAALSHFGKQYGAMMKLSNPTAVLFNGLAARHVEVRQEVKTQGVGMSM